MMTGVRRRGREAPTIFASRLRHMPFGVGKSIQAPDGSESRILIRDTWDTDILDELKPQADDLIIYKHRFSGFYQTDLDSTLRKLGIKHLIITGCTTSVCVEATVRDAMFRDYSCVLLEGCMSQPTLGHSLPGSNHDASLVLAEVFFGWVSRSEQFIWRTRLRRQNRSRHPAETSPPD